MVFDLRNNAFFMLQVTPETSEHDIVKAFEDVPWEEHDKEHEFQSAQNNLRDPNKRLIEELTYLWGVPIDHWEGLFSSTPADWDGLSVIARMNVATHYCFLLTSNAGSVMPQASHSATGLSEKNVKKSDVHLAIEALIIGQEVYREVFEEIKVNRKKHNFALPQETQYKEALAEVSSLYRKAAMHAVETSMAGRQIMAEIMRLWRYDNTASGRFVMELGRTYDKWTIDKLRPIGKKINQVIKVLRTEVEPIKKSGNEYIEYIEGRVSINLEELENLLSEWDEYSQPVQLMLEAKGLDDQRSKEILDKLRVLYQDFDNVFNMPEQSLRIASALHKTFAELPGIASKIASDVKNLKVRCKVDQSSGEIEEWIEIINDIKNNPSDFVADIEHRVSKKHWPKNVAKLFMESTENVLEIYSQQETVWHQLISLANNIFFICGNERAAISLLTVIKEYAEQYEAPATAKYQLEVYTSIYQKISLLKHRISHKVS